MAKSPSRQTKTPTRGAASPYRLPNTVAPVAYRLTIEPDLDKFTYTGSVEIDIDVRRPTKEIVLNAADPLKIVGASIGGLPASASLEKERLVLTSGKPLPKGNSTLALRFAGPISQDLRGFYRSKFIAADGSEHWLGITQFEATSARRAFPCFDEPALKAKFEVTIIVPDGRMAVSNMPVARQDGRRVTFAQTPVMSTYLLMFAVGEFDYIQSEKGDGVPVRVYATPGRAELGHFALETAVRGLKWFDQYYGIPYRQSVPKCDLLAIPDFEAGAMENWGAITFREADIFIAPGESSIPTQQRVAEVVLHELAHQWFGNLVSPEWWSYLWLNESFATFMSYKAMDALFREWNVWEKYVDEITSEGISLDSLRKTHRVEVPVTDPNDIDQIFDAISYNKGGSVLRMLEQAIGDKSFRQGIRLYLKNHRYANAASDDLWNAIGEASATDVRSMMDGWTRQKGLPVLIAKRSGSKLKLAQERFFLDRDPAKPGKDKTLWDIPVAMIEPKGKKVLTRLRKRVIEISAPEGVKLNAAQSGFYLSHYDEEGWKALGARLVSYSTLDRYGLQSDAYSLMRAGYLPIGEYLTLIDGFRKEENYHVWSGLASGLSALADIFVGDEQVPRLETFANNLLRPIVEKVGWKEPDDKSSELKLLRVTVLGAATRFGESTTVEEVRRHFDEARKDLSSVPPNLRGLVFTGAARYGGDEVLEQLIELYEKTDLPETKVRLLRATGAFRREAPLRRAVAYTLTSPKVRAQDGVYVFAGTPIDMRPVAWALVKEYWKTIDERYGESAMIGSIISAAASGIPTEAHAKDVEKFFETHAAPKATKKIEQMLEEIRALAKFRARNATSLKAHFGRNA